MSTGSTVTISNVCGDVLYTSESATDVCDALMQAKLDHADLREANLQGANLWDANLCDANLHGADLRGADLQGAKNIPELAAAQLIIVPDGDLIVWKFAYGINYGRILVRLRIPAGAKRSNATGRKCRAEYAEVLAIETTDGKPYDGKAISWYDRSTVYEVGATVKPTEPFDDDRWNECSSGIHFYLTRSEAVAP